MFSQLKLRNRILLGYAVPLLLSIVVAVLVFINAKQVEQRIADTENTQVVLHKIRDTEAMTIEVQRVARSYFLTQSPEYFADLDKIEKSFEVAIVDLKKVAPTPIQRDMINRLAEAEKKVANYARMMMALEKDGRHSQVVENLKTGESNRLNVAYIRLVEEFQQMERTALEARAEEQANALNFMIRMVWLGTLLSALLAVGMGGWIASRITESMRIAINTISASSSQIAATVDQHERTVSQQAAAITETTTTIEELNVTSRQSAEQAEAAANTARQSQTMTEEGARLVAKACDGIDTMQVKVNAVAEQILMLSEQAAQIGNIANLVSELASETNMLALNAAVEAARAGEHGKGFAVVAAEVRKLADQSKKSAERSNALVQEIQKATNSAVMVTEEGSKTAQEVAAVSRQAGEVFTSVTALSGRVYEMSQQIMLNGKQQSAGLGQLTEAMHSLVVGAEQLSSGTGQTRSGVKSLNEVAQSIKTMV